MEQRKDYIEAQIEMLSKALRKLLEKVLNLKAEDDLIEIEKDLLSQTLSSISTLTLKDILIINDTDLITILKERYGYTNEQLKLLGDVLFDYCDKINFTKNSYSKAKIVYQYYQANEIKTIDFSVFSRLIGLEIKINSFLN
jgi:hypothetical protein